LAKLPVIANVDVSALATLGNQAQISKILLVLHAEMGEIGNIGNLNGAT